MASGEGRLSRWSRLKQKGGADARDEARASEERVNEERIREVAAKEPESAKLPGGVKVRNFVPAMAPLAPEPEDDDDRLTRGVGHDEEEPTEIEDEASLDVPPVDLSHVDISDIEERELTDEEKAVVAELPPLDSLREESDFTPFLQDGVPEFLKRQVLRMLWRSNPFFNFRDGLNDYDDDFNVIHKVISEATGAYQVGRGHLSEEELRAMTPERARKAFDEDDDDEAEDDPGDGGEETQDDSDTPDEENADSAATLSGEVSEDGTKEQDKHKEEAGDEGEDSET